MQKGRIVVALAAAGALLLASLAFSLVSLGEARRLWGEAEALKGRLAELAAAMEAAGEPNAGEEAESLAMELEALKRAIAGMGTDLATLKSKAASQAPQTRALAAWEVAEESQPPLAETPAVSAVPQTAATTAGALKAGQAFVITVSAEELENVYGYQFELRYDKSRFRYDGELKSLLPELLVIFAREKDSYLLVGCTATGDGDGASGRGKGVCQLGFTALADGAAPGEMAVTGVETAMANGGYVEGVAGWNVME